MKVEYKFKDLVCIAFLCLATLFLSLLWFPRTTADSGKYLILVEIFKGNLPYSVAISPFCYRPLMPFIVSLFPTNPLLTWATISVILNVAIVPVMYSLVREFNIGTAGAFTGTGFATVSYMSISVGGWVVTDIAAMFFLGLVFLGIIRDTNKLTIISLLVIGTLFKELVIFGAVVWFIYSALRRDKISIIFSTIGGILSVSVYLYVRVIWTQIGIQSYLWEWMGWFNFVRRPVAVFESFWLSLMFFIPAIILALIIGYKTKVPQFKETLIWLVACSVLIGYMCMGLFMACFGMRFIWPLYFGMVPLVGIFGDWFLPKFYKRISYLSSKFSSLSSPKNTSLENIKGKRRANTAPKNV